MTSENVARLDGGTSLLRASRSIGAILIDAGRLTLEDADRVLRLQRDEKMRFGDAALKLKVLTQADIDFALSRQFDYEYLQRGCSRVAETVVAAYDPFSAQVEAFRTLRSHLMLRWFDGDPTRKILSIVSPEEKEGRSFIAASLAVVFAQLGERVLLIDADLRNPSQHVLFGCENRVGLSAVIAGRQTTPDIERVPGLEHLSILPSGVSPPNPIELLSRPGFARLLDEVKARFDVILVDSPPAARYADAQVIAARAGGALIVLRKNASKAVLTRDIADTLRPNTTLLGTVLNEY